MRIGLLTLVLCVAGAPGASAQTGAGPGRLGPGDRIPEFALPDQSGASRSFRDLTGRNGAMLVFYRSADW